MKRRPAAALLCVPLLLGACSHGGPPVMTPQEAASAPVPGVTLPPGPLLSLVPSPSEVPAGMVPVVLGSGPRDLLTVAGYSGAGAARANAAAALRAHGFQQAYVAQYANQATGQVLSVVVSRFANAAGAAADYVADVKGTTGAPVAAVPVGDASTVTTEVLPGKVRSVLVLVRFRRGADTWVIAYKAAPEADPTVPLALAQHLLARTAT